MRGLEMHALISVYDKTNIITFAKSLAESGVQLVSTGGTHKLLSEEASLLVTPVAEVTQSPEMLDGRVKTLHPRIHGGILALRDSEDHMQQLKDHAIDPIDIVVSNLYPFEQVSSTPGVTIKEAVENIDIGGPSMVRAAAKNFPSVIIVIDPNDYEWIGERIRDNKPISFNERRSLAAKAFQHVALYDTLVSSYLNDDESLPLELTLAYRQKYTLRYGENPHQKAAVYSKVQSSGGLSWATQIQGKELSFNNILDAEAAWNTVSDFNADTVAIIKHHNPCGLASDSDQPTAYTRAFEGDPVSAYGGIVAFNRTVTEETCKAFGATFYEVVVAPSYTPQALTVLQRRKNLRVLEVTLAEKDLDYRFIPGGLLIQDADIMEEDPTTWQIMTKEQPSEKQLEDMKFAWRAAKHVKSNAIVLASTQTLLGMGAGQPNRVTSIHLAIRAAGEKATGSVLASDAMFPFPDNVEAAFAGGVGAIVQPGGSIRDAEIIEAADKLSIPMVFTGVRHFKH
jgi:phosphoribosylaminoimidazolecarboxamide formyltransferase/IMP cyclohydrolase